MNTYRTYSHPLHQPHKYLLHVNHLTQRVTGSKVEVKLNQISKIFDHDQQLIFIKRPLKSEIVHYLKTASNKMMIEFDCIIKNGQQTSLLQKNKLPNLAGRQAFLADLDYLTSLYFDLIGCPQLSLSLKVLNTTMCPKFHVDRTGIRLLCTYQGQGTEWLDDQHADRSQLGPVTFNIDDSLSGLILDNQGIHQIPTFAIALFKGSLWQGNHMRGAIHRSPSATNNQKRIIITINAIW
jgi:hypothetical protein